MQELAILQRLTRAIAECEVLKEQRASLEAQLEKQANDLAALKSQIDMLNTDLAALRAEREQ